MFSMATVQEPLWSSVEHRNIIRFMHFCQCLTATHDMIATVPSSAHTLLAAVTNHQFTKNFSFLFRFFFSFIHYIIFLCIFVSIVRQY